MNADNQDFLNKEETHAIIGCAFEVLNEIGHGLHEKIYENSLVVEFGLRNIPLNQQPEHKVSYKTVSVGKYIPDLIVYDKIVVDTKTIEKITEHERGQMLNYLKITGLKVGLIINFKHAKLEWLRVARK
ncbi:GxxExxY protein [Coraliomargarita sp. SDUM461004]|uniref:GxxExxY protein n=1 Tax=Thalassobacterium sedimentorum TaxID=3041258 RepID=A0ABU1AJ74_9BACT|nr:GxxExxY protein [Coraliomargarita sp. SDUM461004]MDQ8194208.1 GxxExxY protein [Coraliomargarita sp. SDUM461004]